jgi:PAS domain S-box-containing protein
MQKDKRSPGDRDNLRNLAEREAGLPVTGPVDERHGDLEELLYELRIHQAELEIQNEELVRAQAELESARTKYLDLFESAPVGYIVLNSDGIIVDVNLAGRTMLVREKPAVIGEKFVRFVAMDDRDVFYLHRMKVMTTGTKGSCRLRLVKGDGVEFAARLETVAILDEEKSCTELRVALVDLAEDHSA